MRLGLPLAPHAPPVSAFVDFTELNDVEQIDRAPVPGDSRSVFVAAELARNDRGRVADDDHGRVLDGRHCPVRDVNSERPKRMIVQPLREVFRLHEDMIDNVGPGVSANREQPALRALRDQDLALRGAGVDLESRRVPPNRPKTDSPLRPSLRIPPRPQSSA